MENSNRLPFSRSAFLIAPWPVPVACCAVLAFGSDGRQPLLAFGLFLALSLVISYLGTAALVVCLHFVAQARPVTRVVSIVSGALLATVGYLPFVYLSWSSSGPDSGPPIESFPAYLLRNWNDPFLLVFVAGGVVAAALYDTLARRRAPRPQPVT